MHLLLTDRLACPRCGPEFGLILLAERMDERRVIEGSLGCPNCRERYPVEGGHGDFRPPPRTRGADPEPGGGAAALGGGAPDEPQPDEAMRVAALLGVAQGPGNLLLAGRLVRHALPLARMIEEIEVVAVGRGLRDAEEQAGVSRIEAGRRLPFYSGMFRGVALEGDAVERWFDEGIRLVARLGRLVLFGVHGDEGDDVVRRVEAGGLTRLAHEDGVLVAERK